MLKTKCSKICTMVIAFIMLFTYIIFLKGSIIASAFNPVLIQNQEGITGNCTYLNTVYKYNYNTYTAIQLVYKYTSLDSDGKYEDSETGKIKDINYSDTFELLTFDSEFAGWDKTKIGSGVSPVLNKNYTAVVLISNIENRLSTGGVPHGINLQTGCIDETKITIVSYKLVSSDYVQQEFTAEGSWIKGTSSTMTINPKNAATIDANEYNIEVGGINLAAWTNPTVDVTVTYEEIQRTAQAEIKVGGTPVDPNYPRVSAGTYTYTTEIPNTTTSFLACYDNCTVTKIHVYDNVAGNVEASVTGKTAAQIADNMGVAWNLGNSLELVNGFGENDEKASGNPKTTKKLIQTVKAAGFNTIRIPVSYLTKIGDAPDYTIDSAYLDRVQEVVDYAYDMGMYVIIDIHGDGFNNVKNSWIDISTSNVTQAYQMLNKYIKVWTQIADRFSDYDQRLVFESVNEVMIDNYYSESPDPAYSNINALNQVFVNAVRTSGDKNADRVLIIPGYNTDINLTVSPLGSSVGFAKPNDSTENRLMLSVHYMDPYDFTLNTSGTSSWGTDEELSYIEEQFDKISSFASSLDMPIFLGEYGSIDKNNTAVRASYCYWINYYAAQYGIVTAYWDNGDINTSGTALFDRTNNVITSKGNTIRTSILAGYNGSDNPND